MIDLHCHILPETDDGAIDYLTSINMAKKAVSEGISAIVATPHHKNGRYLNEKIDIIEKVNHLNEVLDKEKISLKVLPGQEVRLYGELMEDYRKGEILTVNNVDKYLLLEFPTNHIPYYADQLLFDVQAQGVIPIIVHPERNKKLIENPDILYDFINKGCLAQLTTGSITGDFGKKILNFSHELIHANLIHFLSSDAHNLHSRSFNMQEALSVIERKHGQDIIYMFTENASSAINGNVCIKDIPTKIKKKTFFGIFR
ncbi:tyrosine protein phosphatase [Bacillus sp. H8-1]|nr:tyrosine protein phosphatase [Bacillus sp. H8-1]